MDVSGNDAAIAIAKHGPYRGGRGDEYGDRAGDVGVCDSALKNMRLQWRCTPAGGAGSRQGPGRFNFTGGKVFLDLRSASTSLNTVEPNPTDNLSVEIFAEVYSHELLHVWDNIDILTNCLPSRIETEPNVAQYLVRGETYTYGRSSESIAEVERGFHTYIQNTLQTDVHNLFAVEANRRSSLRDAPAEYDSVQQRINDLRARQINR